MKNIFHLIAVLLVVNAKAQSPEFKRSFEEGNSKFKLKNFSLAMGAYDKAISIIEAEAQKAILAKTPLIPGKKYLAEVYAKRAACYYRMGGNTGSMMRDAGITLALDRENPDAIALIASTKSNGTDKKNSCILMGRQRLKGSEIADRVFDDCFCWPEGIALAKEAETDANLRKYDVALKKLNEAIEILPDSGFIYATRAKCYLGKNEPEKALADMNLAIAKHARTYKVYYLRAEAFLKAKKADSAFLDLNKCLDLKPDYYEGYVLRAEVNEELEQWNAAIYDYRQLIKNRPDFGPNYYKCALVMHNHHDDLLGACDMYQAAANRGVEEAKEMATNCGSPKWMKAHLKKAEK